MCASDDRLLALALALASATLVSCARAPDVPDTPDLSTLVSAYKAPSGTVDVLSAPEWLDSGATQVDLLGGGQARVLLARVAANVLKAVDAASLPDGHGEVVDARVDGVATLVVPCGSKHETADVAVAIVDGEISPLMWGTSHACPLWQGGGLRESYDGLFSVYRYPGSDLLVRVDGTLALAGLDVHLDFRLTGAGSQTQLETRILTPAGDLIVRREGGFVVARASNGTFRCNTQQRVCTRTE
jgi:hypothetical protein